MEWIVSNRKRKLTIIVAVALVAFSTVFLLTGAIMTSVYGVTVEQESMARDENGEYKAYTDCGGYEDYTESLGISKEDADLDTETVDQRIITLQVDMNEGKVSEENDTKVQKELDCLSAIRAVEKEAMVKMAEKTDELLRGIDALQTLNELGMLQ
jgi:hypothetical protein